MRLWARSASALVVFPLSPRPASNQESQNAAKAMPKYRALPAPEYPPIKELDNFVWKEKEPVKQRPFKPKYHLTMGDFTALESLDPSELILMDKNYEDRINYRRKILKEHHDVVVSLTNEPRIDPAIREMYQFIMGTYLPTRYPNMFKLHQTEFGYGKDFLVQNLVTGELLPAQPRQGYTKSITLLETLCKQIDEDFLILLPEENVENAKYILEAYSTVCASGFDPQTKIGKRLSDIHDPVPAYKDKLEGSMDRFFANLEVGKYVKRANWTITTQADLFAAFGGTHAYEGDKIEELDEIDIDKTFLRSERQTLYRLPKSNALVFAFKTYLYPIKDIKDEGLGEDLAQAIDGFGQGNAPEMHRYKSVPSWGKAVKTYLRS